MAKRRRKLNIYRRLKLLQKEGHIKISFINFRKIISDGELSHHMNIRVPSEPRSELRKRNHSQQQQNCMLLLIHKFEKLFIHEMNEGSISKTFKESVDPKGIIFPPPFTY